MRISTRQYYDIAQQSMARSAGEAYTWQKRLASGIRIDRASDDPAAAARAVILNTRQSRIQLLRENQDYAVANLSDLDTAISALQNQVAVLQEISVQAGNGTLNSEGYSALEARANQALQEMEVLAAQKDAYGRRLFGEEARLDVQEGFSVATLLDLEEVFGASVDATYTNSELSAAVNSIVDALAAKRAPTEAEVEALASAEDKLSLARTHVGLDSNSVDNARNTLDAYELGLIQEKSELLDTDIAQGVSEFSRSQTLLETARSLFARIDSMGLFGMLK